MNKWDARHAQCINKSGQNQPSFNPNSNLFNTAPITATLLKTYDWIRCENVICKKWHKIPQNINPLSLPSPFYCVFNTWNDSIASCDGPLDYNFEVMNVTNMNFDKYISNQEDQKSNINNNISQNNLKRGNQLISRTGRVIKRTKYYLEDEVN